MIYWKIVAAQKDTLNVEAITTIGEIVDCVFDNLFYIVSQIHVGVSKEYDLLEIELWLTNF